MSGLAGDNPFDSRRIERAEARVRELEDAALLLWAVLNVGQTKALRYEHPWNNPEIDVRDWDRDG